MNNYEIDSNRGSLNTGIYIRAVNDNDNFETVDISQLTLKSLEIFLRQNNKEVAIKTVLHLLGYYE